jgi:hypothetical protein
LALATQVNSGVRRRRFDRHLLVYEQGHRGTETQRKEKFFLFSVGLCVSVACTWASSCDKPPVAADKAA